MVKLQLNITNSIEFDLFNLEVDSRQWTRTTLDSRPDQVPTTILLKVLVILSEQLSLHRQLQEYLLPEDNAFHRCGQCTRTSSTRRAIASWFKLITM